jgi:hypothetical protein
MKLIRYKREINIEIQIAVTSQINKGLTRTPDIPEVESEKKESCLKWELDHFASSATEHDVTMHYSHKLTKVYFLHPSTNKGTFFITIQTLYSLKSTDIR